MRKQLLKKEDERGSALVEFALVIPIFVFVLYALIAFGMQLATTQRVVNAASEGARAAIGASTPALAQSQATARITDALGSPGSSPSPRYTVSFPGPSCAGCIDVRVTYNYDDHPAVPAGLGINYKKITSTAVVKYQ